MQKPLVLSPLPQKTKNSMVSHQRGHNCLYSVLVAGLQVPSPWELGLPCAAPGLSSLWSLKTHSWAFCDLIHNPTSFPDPGYVAVSGGRNTGLARFHSGSQADPLPGQAVLTRMLEAAASPVASAPSVTQQ